MALPSVRDERRLLIDYLRGVEALLARQSDLTLAMARDAQRHIDGEIGDDALAQAALDQLEAYRELEADASALVVPACAARAHALFARSFSACAEAHQQLLRSLDHGAAPDMRGFVSPSLYLREATRHASLAAAALGA